MKKKEISSYKKPYVEIVLLEEDVITLSTGENTDMDLWPADANSIQN